jgi:uncharacterized protein
LGKTVFWANKAIRFKNVVFGLNSSLMPVAFPENNLVEILCTQCAMCCNGVLFADVRLKAGDSAARLAEAGFVLKKDKKTSCFDQPCSALKNNVCSHYVLRPQMCRSFECRLLLAARAGQRSRTQALALIRQAKKEVDRVKFFLKSLGNRDDHLPLNIRYSQTIMEPLDLGGDTEILRMRNSLSRAVHRLAEIISKEFIN